MPLIFRVQRYTFYVFGFVFGTNIFSGGKSLKLITITKNYESSSVYLSNNIDYLYQ